MQVICIELISLYVHVFIPSVNEHCDHYLIVIACLHCLMDVDNLDLGQIHQGFHLKSFDLK